MVAPVSLVGLAIALLWEFIEWALVAALLIIWRATLGAMLLYIADRMVLHIKFPGYNHHFDLGGPFRTAENAVRTWLAVERDGLSIEIGATWHAIQELWYATVRMVEWSVSETGAALDRLEHMKIPAWAKWAAAAALPAALFSKLVAAVIAKIRPELHKGATVVENVFPTKVLRIVKHAAAGALTLPGWVIHVPRELRDIRADLRKLRHALRNPATWIGATAAAGIIANALGLSVRCIRRGNLNRAARQVCGMDSSLLGSLLTDGLLIVGAISVVEFAEALLAIEGEAVAILGAGIREFPG